MSGDRNHIFVTRNIPDAGLEVLAGTEARVTVHQKDETKGLSRDELLAGVRGCDVLLCQLTEPIDREVLAANERLLGVAQMAVGFNNVDVEAATELGVPVANTREFSPTPPPTSPGRCSWRSPGGSPSPTTTWSPTVTRSGDRTCCSART